MDPEAMKPYGIALLDYYNGNISATVDIIRDDGLVTPLPVSTFFRHARDIELERIALEMTQGRTLDVGAGAGLHSLFLQEKSLTVCAVDVSPEAIQVMRGRGVIDVRQADIMSFREGKFDTIIMMGHGIGIVEDISGLDQFLSRVRTLLKLGGQIFLTSLDVRSTSDSLSLLYQRKNTQSGRYIGEIRMQFRYAGLTGPMFGWLHVDRDTLTQHASEFGWHCEVIRKQEDGNYLARLCSIVNW